MNQEQKQFLDKAYVAAAHAGHPFAQMAACEAALESGYGHSILAVEDLNLFGMKQHTHPTFGTVALPTREFEHGRWIPTAAKWVNYPNWQACFSDRLATLARLALIRKPDGSLKYPHYLAALSAQTPEDYITEVSQSWSTDPQRADKVLAIYREYTA